MIIRCYPMMLTVFTGFTLALSACGSADSTPEEEEGKGRGYIQCGGVTCSPGQYCNNLFCLNGCTSDDNCKEGSSCQDIDTVIGAGTCSETVSADQGVPPPPQNRCSGKFKLLVTCGLIEPVEEPYAEEGCATTLSDTDIRAWDACVQTWGNCEGAIPQCILGAGLECGPKFPCAAGTCATYLNYRPELMQTPHRCY